MFDFRRIERLPPYVFSVVNELKTRLRKEGEDIVDLGMGNPDQPPPAFIIEKLKEAIYNPKNHRYSMSKGIPKLRVSFAEKYKRKFGVELDPETECVVTIGSKEGLSHLMFAILSPGDVVIVPEPTYPIHKYSVIIADGDVRTVPLTSSSDFLDGLERAVRETWPKPKAVIISFPHNPTTETVDKGFFEKIVQFAKENHLLVIHDFAYGDITFDNYVAPSILSVKGAREVCVEFFTMSKSYNMPGWRIGFCAGNSKVIHALTRLKSYLDYGIFQPLQIAAIIALNQGDEAVKEIVNMYKSRRDTLCNGLERIGWKVKKPLGTMFVWAKIPEAFEKMGSLEFSKILMTEGKVAVSPGIGFGNHGEGYVRFALVENEHRINQAIRGIKRFFEKNSR